MDEFIRKEDAITDAFCEGIRCIECPFFFPEKLIGCKIQDYFYDIPSADVVSKDKYNLMAEKVSEMADKIIKIRELVLDVEAAPTIIEEEVETNK